MKSRIFLFIFVILYVGNTCSECKPTSILLGTHYRYTKAPFTFTLTVNATHKYIFNNVAALQDEAILALIDYTTVNTFYLTHPNFPFEKILLEAVYHQENDILSYSIIPRSLIHRTCYIPLWKDIGPNEQPLKYRQTSYSNTVQLHDGRYSATNLFDNGQIWSRIKYITNDTMSFTSNTTAYPTLHTEFNSSKIYLMHYIKFWPNTLYTASVATTEYSASYQSSPTQYHRITIPKLNISMIQPIHSSNGSVSFFYIPIESLKATLYVYTSFSNYFEYDINTLADMGQELSIPLFKSLIANTRNIEIVLDSIHPHANINMTSIKHDISTTNASFLEKFCSKKYGCYCMSFTLATRIKECDAYIVNFQFSHSSNSANIHVQNRIQYYKEHELSSYSATNSLVSKVI